MSIFLKKQEALTFLLENSFHNEFIKYLSYVLFLQVYYHIATAAQAN